MVSYRHASFLKQLFLACLHTALVPPPPPSPTFDNVCASISEQVHFLHEEELLESLHEAVKDKLGGANESRTFYSQVTEEGSEKGRRKTQERDAWRTCC